MFPRRGIALGIDLEDLLAVSVVERAGDAAIAIDGLDEVARRVVGLRDDHTVEPVDRADPELARACVVAAEQKADHLAHGLAIVGVVGELRFTHVGRVDRRGQAGARRQAHRVAVDPLVDRVAGAVVLPHR